jgi:AraC-like DNA-binding protein
MLNKDTIIIISYSLPVYQLLFFTIQLVSFQKSFPSRKYLGLLLLSMTIFLIIHAVYHLGYNETMQLMYYFFIPLLLFIPPIFYLYLNSLAHKDSQINTFSRLMLLFPAMLVFVLNLVAFSLITPHSRRVFLASDHTLFNTSIDDAGAPLIILWISLVIFLAVQIGLAVYKTMILIRKERSLIEKRADYLAHIHINWVYIIAFSLLVFIVAGVLQILIFGSGGFYVSIIFNMILLISSGLAGYYGMKQDELIRQVSGVGAIRGYLVSASNGRLPSGAGAERKIADEDSLKMIQKIEEHLKTSKSFLTKGYTIDELSKQIDEKRNNISSVINSVLGKNFHGLVNDFRVREAIRIMENDKSNPTMDALAEMVGFRSRSSFFACFKQYTGQTPREFIAKIESLKD